MLLLILIHYLANVHMQDIQIRSGKTVAGENQNCSTFFQRELLYSQTDPYNIQIPEISGSIVNFIKYVVFGDSSREHFEIISKIKNNVDTDKERFSGNGIEFDLRRREDAYKKTDPKDFPYTVSLLIIFGNDTLEDKNPIISSCTGSLLTAEWVLTAKHCIVHSINVSKVYVYAGGNSVKELIRNAKDKVPLPLSSQLIISEKFLTDDQGYDIALIKLPEKFNLTDTVSTIQLASEPWKHRGYQKCVTTAFGGVFFEDEHEDDYSRKTHQLEVKQPCLCNFMLDPFVSLSIPGTLGIKSVVCAKPRMDFGLCGGDSGGGLVCDGLVVAVNMLIIEFEDVAYCELNIFERLLFGGKPICGSKNTISVFQLICPSLPWINEKVNLFNNTSDCWHLKSVGILVTFRYWTIATGILIPFITM